MRNKEVIYKVICISLFLGIIYSYFFSFLRFNDWDTPNFINATRTLFGYPSDIDFQARITKPFVLLIPGILFSLFSISITIGMYIQNWLFWIGTGILFSKWLKNLNFSDNKQLLGVFILYTTPPIFVHSFELITDIAGYFFICIQLYIYSLIQKKADTIFANKIVLAIIFIVGMLSKESSIIAVVYIIISEFYSNKKNVLRWILLYLLLICIYVLLQYVITGIYNKETFLHYYATKLFENKGLIIQWKQIIRGFDMYWIFIIAGILYSWKNRNKEQIYTIFITTFFVSFCIAFVWPLVQDRTISIITPIIVVLILLSQNTRQGNYIIIGIGIANSIITYIVYVYAIPYTLYVYYLVSVFVIYFLWITSKRKIIFE